jgi:SynChlorMet cassette protein ScmC
MASPETACLRLRDGTSWVLKGAGTGGCGLVRRLRKVMQLPVERPCGEAGRMVVDEAEACAGEQDTLGRLIALSFELAAPTIAHGGGLVHGALASRAGTGVLLTGVSGVGKSTASARLAPPWRSLCDDTALVVRDADGAYWAHPWPTWSRLFDGHVEDTWNVPAAVPLAAVCRLTRDPINRPAALPVPEAAGWLLDRLYDCSWDVFRDRPPDEARAIQVQLFHNACDLAAAVPVFPLQVTLENAFWEAMQGILGSRTTAPR